MSKLISTQSALRNIISKLGLRDVQDLPIFDMIVWMAEALHHIGSYGNLEEKSKKVRVVNYTGEWPLDLYAVKRIVGHPKFISKRRGFVVDIESGEVVLIYDSLPKDDEGFPLISDDPSTAQALMWYVAGFLALSGKLPNTQLSHAYCADQWQWYCGQARAEGYTPSIDQWERMVNIFYTLIPNKDEYANNFAGLNVAENLEIDKLNAYSNGRNNNTI